MNRPERYAWAGYRPPGAPGRFLAEHPALYGVSLAGSGGAVLYAAWRSMRATGRDRVPWVALAALQAAITTGIVGAHTTARSASGPGP